MVAAGHWEGISADSRRRSDAAFVPNGGVVELDDKVDKVGVSQGCGKTVKGDDRLCNFINGMLNCSCGLLDLRAVSIDRVGVSNKIRRGLQ